MRSHPLLWLDDNKSVISSFYVCMVNIKLKYNFVETPRTVIILMKPTALKQLDDKLASSR